MKQTLVNHTGTSKIAVAMGDIVSVFLFNVILRHQLPFAHCRFQE